MCADDYITVNSFKCAVHPLLQFGRVAQKKVDEIEKGKKSMSMSTIDKTDPITKSNVDKLMPMLRKVYYTCLIIWLKAVPCPEGCVLNTLSDTSIL
jgi:hypothetical protein